MAAKKKTVRKKKAAVQPLMSPRLKLYMKKMEDLARGQKFYQAELVKLAKEKDKLNAKIKKEKEIIRTSRKLKRLRGIKK